MRAEMGRERVQGFLGVQGQKIVNGAGQEILLTGWGLGNWLLCEGYMWLSGGNDRMDRPRRIEALVEELAGPEYAQAFWPQFRATYITEEDIAYMARLGYNSVRIPINARLFLKEGPGLHWIGEGFELLDRCIDWCEAHGLYAFIDLHGAPGGQTGSNIDDSIDDLPRLLMDQDCFDKGVQLWKKLAERYKDRWIVGGYDLLNEPIRTVRSPGDVDVTYLLPRLAAFYDAAIAEIRKVDTRHLVTLEGHYWASAPDVFYKRYDDKMVAHFHRYACLPDIASYEPFLKVRERLNCPLWLGETGENVTEWFTAMYPLAIELGIGYNLWPYKKMGARNCPCTIEVPEGWDTIVKYANGGPHPGYAKAQKILTAYLENLRLESCTRNEGVTRAVFRQPGCTIRCTDFDELPGRGASFSGLRGEENLYPYRRGTGMHIVDKFPGLEKEFGFDCLWRRFVLSMGEGEFACYTLFDITSKARMELRCYCKSASVIRISQDDKPMGTFTLGGLEEVQSIGSLRLTEAERACLRIEVLSGEVEFESIITS